MKNTLLCTTALAMTGIAGAANAAAITNGALTVNVSGFFTQHIAATTVDTGINNAATDFDGVDLFTNAEVWIQPSVTLDNGIKIGADIQIEAGSGPQGDIIDESYMTIQGDFGKFIIGSENSVGYKMQVGAPDASFIFATSSSLTAFVPYSSATAGADVFRGTLGSEYTENNRVNDSNRISYFSPRFSGLQLGVSYARDSGQGAGAVDNNAVGMITDYIDVAANYSGSFGGVDVNASARYGTASGAGATMDPEIWGAGLSIGMNGFTVGGSFSEQDGTALRDGNGWSIGAGYSAGPTSYSLTYFEGTNQDNEGVDNIAGTVDDGIGKEHLDTIMAAVRYKVAANFKVGAFIANTDFSENLSRGDDIEGTVLGLSASLSF